MESMVFDVETGHTRRVVDITPDLARWVADRGDGLLSIFVPHATAGLAIVETGSGSDADLLDTLETLIPHDESRYRHRHGAAGHGADHVIPGIVSPSVVVPVIDGVLTLGTWQSVVLVDPNVDNPSRTVRATFIGG